RARRRGVRAVRVGLQGLPRGDGLRTRGRTAAPEENTAQGGSAMTGGRPVETTAGSQVRGEGEHVAKTERAITGRSGLSVKRYFTKPEVHPYDDVSWEIRDAVIPNFKEGGNAFEQLGVEFPLSWSQNATK